MQHGPETVYQLRVGRSYATTKTMHHLRPFQISVIKTNRLSTKRDIWMTQMGLDDSNVTHDYGRSIFPIIGDSRRFRVVAYPHTKLCSARRAFYSTHATRRKLRAA